MPTFRGCYEIDSHALLFSEFTLLKSDSEMGKLMRQIDAAYLAGDYEFVRSIPFIRKVYPKASEFYRKHIPAHVRRDVLSSGPCVRCGTLERLTVDHIIPVSKGGKDHRENLQPMCSFCNISKGNRT